MQEENLEDLQERLAALLQEQNELEERIQRIRNTPADVSVKEIIELIDANGVFNDNFIWKFMENASLGRMAVSDIYWGDVRIPAGNPLTSVTRTSDGYEVQWEADDYETEGPGFYGHVYISKPEQILSEGVEHGYATIDEHELLQIIPARHKPSIVGHLQTELTEPESKCNFLRLCIKKLTYTPGNTAAVKIEL